MIKRNEIGVVRITLCLSPETVEMLLDLANECHAAPDQVAASLLHDILADDAAAHHDQHVPAGTHIH
jgi:hypothetical protein